MFIINFCLNMFRASLCPSSGEQRPCYCICCIVLVLLDVVGSGCGALACRMWALWQFMNTKWATFTYISPLIRRITNLFKHTNVRIAYKCNSTILHLSKPTNKATLPSSPYDRSVIYKLTRMTCDKAYVGQTNRNLKQRYKEHTRYIKNNNPQSAYAPPYPQQPTWIRNHRENNDPPKTPQKHLPINPIWTVLYTRVEQKPS
jgi:hypothetical protein